MTDKKANTFPLGNGITGLINENKLMLEIDLDSQFKISKSGENVTVATTGGNQPLAWGNQILRIGLNVFRPMSVEEITEHLEEIQGLQALAALKKTG